MPTYRLSTPVLNASAEDLFAWHARRGALPRLVPPWEPLTFVSHSDGGLEVGVRVEIQAKVGPIPVRWVSVHTACDRPHGFTDEQEQGPFVAWRHQHRFLDAGDGAVLEDEIAWEAPFGALGAAVAGIEQRLDRAFRFRHRRTLEDLSRHAPCRDRPRLRVLVSGASGLVGTALSAFLDAGGHEVVPLKRQGGRLVLDGIDGADAVVHLAGAPIEATPWDERGRELIRSSRVDMTRRLCEDLAKLAAPPRVLVSASAVGVYGEGGDKLLSEDAPSGDTSLASMGRAWEEATAPAREAGIRVVNLRSGVVLSASGGYLARMLPFFRAGLGGPQGSGRHYLPWIHLDDELGLIHEALLDERYEGPVNAVAPVAVPQRDFARTLGRVLCRPAFAPAPAFVLHALLGRDKARELVLISQRVVPAVATRLGFRFLHPDLEEALKFELGAA